MASDALHHEAAESTALVNELSASLKQSFSTTFEYDSVHAILMYWEDDDLQVEDEIQRLKHLFTDTWQFGVSTLRIPSERPQATLQTDLSRLVFGYGVSASSLIIIYYGGHGDANPGEKKAVWAA